MIPELQTFFLAMTPIGELRISIPTALTIFHLDVIRAYLFSVLGNLVPVVFLLFFLEPIAKWLSSRFSFLKRIFDWLFSRTRRKYGFKIEKYGYPALALFVAIPLPFTGAWTGSLIAFLFGISFKKAFSAISLGVLAAGGIVSFMVLTGLAIEKYLGWQILLVFILTLILGFWICNNKINKKNEQ
ncbi:MAG: small multi-drug export protein [Parcubacteria group bacterium]